MLGTGRQAARPIYRNPRALAILSTGYESRSSVVDGTSAMRRRSRAAGTPNSRLHGLQSPEYRVQVIFARPSRSILGVGLNIQEDRPGAVSPPDLRRTLSSDVSHTVASNRARMRFLLACHDRAAFSIASA